MNHGVLPRQGEDSYSILSKSPVSLLCVADGCGGLGSRRYAELDGQTGAHAASRVAAQSVKRWAAACRCLPKTPAEGKEWQHSLQETLETDLNAFVQEHRLTEGRSRIVGSMQRLLPTTLCIALADGGERACFLWAGDSRGYVLDEDGLHLYTRDDVKRPMDELERLRCDAPLSLCVSADRPVRLHLRSVALPKQGLLICATDGVYGCVFSPMELEEIFLASLTGAQDAATWQRRLAAAIRRLAGDDATLCCLPFGFAHFDEMKRFFEPRLELLRREHLDGLRRHPGDGDVLRESWKRYQPGYDRTEEVQYEKDWSL